MKSELERTPPPLLDGAAHKGSAGRLFALAGSRVMSGAAILLARAAQRSGAGLVTVGCLDPELIGSLPIAAPEAILADLTGFASALAPEHASAVPSVNAADLLIENAAFGDAARQPHALVAGPGLGRSQRTTDVVAALLTTLPGTPRVLDADALFAFSGEPGGLRAASGPLVITPHPGEAARLLGRDVPRAVAGRVAFARELARESGAVVCLKGSGTVVTDGTRVCVNATGNPGLATAGTGDVLTGILAAFLARAAAQGELGDVAGLAASAVWTHGHAADLVAMELGSTSLVASDLIDALPDALLALEATGEEAS